MFAQCTNCLMWTVYGLSIGDVWVYGPNGTGLVLGLVQAALWLIYPSVPTSSENRSLVAKESCSDVGSDDVEGDGAMMRP